MGQFNERQAEQEDAIAAAEDALNEIAGAGREPDLWERVFLAEAIGAIFRGLYMLAIAGAAKAMTPADKRSPGARLPAEPYDRFDLAVLRQALEEARAQPIELYGHFGPVVFTGGAAR